MVVIAVAPEPESNASGIWVLHSTSVRKSGAAIIGLCKLKKDEEVAQALPLLAHARHVKLEEIGFMVLRHKSCKIGAPIVRER